MLTDRFDKGQAFRLFTASIGAALVATLLVVLLNPLLGFFGEDGKYTTYGFWIVNVITQGVLIAVVLVFCKIFKTNYLKVTALDKKVDFKVILLAFGIGVGMFLLMNPIQMWVLELFEYFGYVASSSIPLSTDPLNVILLVLVVGVLPSFAEEQLFRGAITRGLSSMGLIPACLLSGAMFMIFHMNPAQTLHQFVMGFVLAFLVLKSGSVYTSIVVHLFNNLAVIALSLGLGVNTADKIIADYWYLFLFGGLVIAGACFYAFLKLTKDNKIQKTQQDDQNQEVAVKVEQSKTKNRQSSDVMILCVGFMACLVMWLSNLTSNMGG